MNNGKVKDAIPIICHGCKAEFSLSLTRVAVSERVPTCPHCGSADLDLSEKIADWDQNNDAELSDVPAVSQHVRCSNCFYEFDVKATDPAQPLPNCPNCGSKAVSVAGSTQPYKSNPGAGRPPLGNVAKQAKYSVQQMQMGANEQGEEWGVWSDEAQDYIAYMSSRLDADDAAARWNRNPMLAPDHSQFHDPTMFGTRPASKQSSVAHAQSLKIAEITAGILTTNPGMRRQAAIALARKTIEQFPMMVQAAAISNEEVESMRSKIAPLDTEERRKKYLSGDYPRANTTKDLDTRYRWDLHWESGAHDSLKSKDYKDAHIDTALRKIVKPLKTGARKTAAEMCACGHTDEHHGLNTCNGMNPDPDRPGYARKCMCNNFRPYDHSKSPVQNRGFMYPGEKA
jgi:Zn finger protein HypA/HybF involved in hydrogenase expression